MYSHHGIKKAVNRHFYTGLFVGLYISPNLCTVFKQVVLVCGRVRVIAGLLHGIATVHHKLYIDSYIYIYVTRYG